MNPSTSLAPGFDTSTTATVLLSALATSSRLPSGDRLTWFGVDPGGAFGNIAIEICSTAAARATSIAQTAFVLAHATNSRRPSLVIASAFGCSPVAISPRLSSVRASKTSTFAPPQSDTYSVEPSGDTRHEYGSAGSATVRITRPLAISTSDTP